MKSMCCLNEKIIGVTIFKFIIDLISHFESNVRHAFILNHSETDKFIEHSDYFFVEPLFLFLMREKEQHKSDEYH